VRQEASVTTEHSRGLYVYTVHDSKPRVAAAQTPTRIENGGTTANLQRAVRRAAEYRRHPRSEAMLHTDRDNHLRVTRRRIETKDAGVERRIAVPAADALVDAFQVDIGAL
jgi:hypothetical protein